MMSFVYHGEFFLCHDVTKYFRTYDVPLNILRKTVRAMLRYILLTIIAHESHMTASPKEYTMPNFWNNSLCIIGQFLAKCKTHYHKARIISGACV